MARKAKDTPHLRVRVEPSLLTRLEKAAEKNERTLNGEIVRRLEESFKRDDMQDLIVATAQRIKEQLLAAGALTSAEQSKIISDESFELELRAESERNPDIPVEELAKQIREYNARRHARRLALPDLPLEEHVKQLREWTARQRARAAKEPPK
jgi:hypothetical protein